MVYLMDAIEAKAYGQRVKRGARAAVEMGDAGTIILNVEWQLADKSYKLGIIGADGLVNMHGEIAQAFRAGFTGRK
jgi:hypothetical protein